MSVEPSRDLCVHWARVRLIEDMDIPVIHVVPAGTEGLWAPTRIGNDYCTWGIFVYDGGSVQCIDKNFEQLGGDPVTVEYWQREDAIEVSS